MPNFAYAPGVSQNLSASGQVVAPTLAGNAALQFPKSGGGVALQNQRGTSIAAQARAAYGNSNGLLNVTDDMHLPGTLGPGGAWTSPLMFGFGAQHTSLAVLSTQGGSMVLSTYADHQATLLVSTATATMVANVSSVLDTVSSALMQAYTFSVTNTSASTATLSSAIALLAAK